MLLWAIYDETPTFATNPWPFIALMLAGFVIGIYGHIVKQRAIVALGIGLIFVATFIVPILLNIIHSGP